MECLPRNGANIKLANNYDYRQHHWYFKRILLIFPVVFHDSWRSLPVFEWMASQLMAAAHV